MPRFIGTLLPPWANQTAFKEVYELAVDPPIGGDYAEDAILSGLIPIETSRSHRNVADALRSRVAEELARQFGAQLEGDTIDIALREVLFDGTTVRFFLPIVVYFAVPQRGPEYIQIGTSDIDDFFEISREGGTGSDPFLLIKLREDSARACIEQQGPGRDLVGSSDGQ